MTDVNKLMGEIDDLTNIGLPFEILKLLCNCKTALLAQQELLEQCVVLEEGSKYIPLNKGLFATVDAKDYEYLMQWKWRVLGTKFNCSYAVRTIAETGANISMHQQLLNQERIENTIIDHINHNGLDNRRSNIRICTPTQNNYNQRLRKSSVTGFKGVYYSAKQKKYIAQIAVDGKPKYLGSFHLAVEAAKIYDAKAIELYGDFAQTNKMLGLYA